MGLVTPALTRPTVLNIHRVVVADLYIFGVS
jgi:hypothetical protein